MMEWQVLMSITKKSSGGFTLLELLIALTLSVIVVSGVYATFNSLLNTKEATENSYYKNSLLLSARRVMKPDLLQMYKDTLSIRKNSENDSISVVTNNSIKMEKAFPVTVNYYVDSNNYLVREETSAAHSYEWKLLLMPNVTEFTVQSHNGYRFTDDTDEMDTIIKISMKVSDYPLEFIAGTANTSKTTDYAGKTWQ